MSLSVSVARSLKRKKRAPRSEKRADASVEVVFFLARDLLRVMHKRDALLRASPPPFSRGGSLH